MNNCGFPFAMLRYMNYKHYKMGKWSNTNESF